MARLLLLCLILADTCAVLAMAQEKPDVPAAAAAGVPLMRKLGKHHSRLVGSPALSPSSPPDQRAAEKSQSPANQTAAFGPKEEEGRIVEGEKVAVKKQQHHAMDKSVAGGGVILGGLATAFLVAVFCYIRATGRKSSETTPELT